MIPVLLCLENITFNNSAVLFITCNFVTFDPQWSATVIINRKDGDSVSKRIHYIHWKLIRLVCILFGLVNLLSSG